MAFTAELLPTSLKEAVGKFKNLVKEKGQQGQQVKVERQKLPTVPKVVFEVVSLVF